MSEDSAQPPAATSAVLRLRGLPFQATEAEIVDFFGDVELEQVVLCRRNGRATGEAYVQLRDPEDAAEAMKLNKKYVGRRYIELFEASLNDLATVKALSEENKGYVVRLRGLPYSSKPSNVISFLSPVEVLGNEDGVVFTYQADGRPTGEAYVELPSEDAAQQAMKKHKETLGSRYIEVFSATMADFLQAQQQARLGPVLAAGRRRYLPQHLQLAGQAGLAAATGPRFPGLPFTPGPAAGPVEDISEQFFRGFNISSRPPGAAGPPRPSSAGQLPYMQYPQEASEQQSRQQQGGSSGTLGRMPGNQMMVSPDMQQAQMYMQPQYMMQSQLMHNQQMPPHGMRYDQPAWPAVPGGPMGPGMPVQPGAPGMRQWFKAFGGAASQGWAGNPMYSPAMAGYPPPMGMQAMPPFMEQQRSSAHISGPATSHAHSQQQHLQQQHSQPPERPQLPAAEDLEAAATAAPSAAPPAATASKDSRR